MLLEGDPLAARADWLAERRNGIGSSDIPKIAGLSKWGGALSVYYEKVEGDTDDGVNESAQIGQELEPWLAAKAASKLERRLVTVPTIAHPVHAHHRASLDRLAVGGAWRPADPWFDVEGFVELKTALGWAALDWADEGVVPPGYYAQVQWQRYVSGLPRAWLVVLLGIPVEGEMVKVFEVPGDPEYQAGLVQIADRFWECVQERRPPMADGLDSTVDLLKKRWTPDPDSVVVLDRDEFLRARDTYRQAHLDLADATGRKQAAQNQIRVQLGTAEAGVLDGEYVATWKASAKGVRTLRIPDNPKRVDQ